jgi:phosphatidylserine/phosphatidylglycerophosphate/cardiolipin synthase-like enzyme
MTQAEIDALLTRTFSDRRLSGNERRVLGELLEESGADEQKLGFVRHRAFELARSAVIDPAAAQVLDWLEEVVKTLQPRPRKEEKETQVEAHFGPGEDCPACIIRLFNAARRKVDVCVFTITHDRISSAILAAHRRGVTVRIITDNEKAFDLGSDIERLEQGGIPLRFDRTPFHMHHKYAIVDDERVLTGSYNWTRSAAESNMENLIVSSDPRLVHAFARNFEHAWQTLA